jgi:hypothetical protein
MKEITLKAKTEAEMDKVRGTAKLPNFLKQPQSVFGLVPNKEYKTDEDNFTQIAGEVFVYVHNKNVRIERFHETPEVREIIAKLL